MSAGHRAAEGEDGMTNIEELDRLIKVANDWPANSKVWDAQKDIVDLAYSLSEEIKDLRNRVRKQGEILTGGKSEGPLMTFVFVPKEYVWVTLFGLRYKGRVVRSIYEGGNSFLYDVQYANDQGEVKRGEFLADEIELLTLAS